MEREGEAKQKLREINTFSVPFGLLDIKENLNVKTYAPSKISNSASLISALPITIPLTSSFPAAIVKSPVEAPVAVVVPTINLSLDSSQAIIALSPVDPLSITIPQSFAFELAPLFNSSKLSVTVVFVVLTVVVVPFTVKFPAIVKFALPVKPTSPLKFAAAAVIVPVNVG